MMSISMHLGHWLCCGPSYNLVCNMILVCEPIVDVPIKDFFIKCEQDHSKWKLLQYSSRTVNIFCFQIFYDISFSFLEYLTLFWNDDDDDDDELFCGMVDQRKALSLISSRDHCQRSSQSQISNTPQARFEPAQNLSLDLVVWSCAWVITTTPWRATD